MIDDNPADSRPYGVHIGFHYIRYMEGTDTLEIGVEPMAKGPAFIYFPSRDCWKSEMPEWARERRDVILARIKKETNHLNWTWEEY